MAPLLQRFRKDWGKQKDDARARKDLPVKIRVEDSRDPDLSLRLSTTQEELLKDLSTYVKENDAAAPAGRAAKGTAATCTYAAASPSTNTEATVPASPLLELDTPENANKGSSSLPSTSMSMNLPTNLVGDVSAITRRDEEGVATCKEDGGEDKDSEAFPQARSGHRAAARKSVNGSNTKVPKANVPTTAQNQTHAARPRSLRDAFDSAADAKIFGDAEDLHGDPEFARRNSAGGNSNGRDSTSGGGFSPYGEINDTTTTTSSSRSSRSSSVGKERRLSQDRDVAGSSHDNSYSFNESCEEEFGKMSLYEELVDFFCGDCAVPTYGGDHDRRSRSSATTGRMRRRRRRGSSSRRGDRRRPGGSRGRSDTSRSRRHK